MTAYAEFLAAKVRMAPQSGFIVQPSDVHPMLKPHQNDIVRWGVLGGRRAIFAAFGLGKTLIQLEISRLILKLAGGMGMIVAGYGIRREFIEAAGLLGISLRYIRTTEEADGPGLYITNYEPVRDGKIDPSVFTVVSLDEASILRSYGSKTFQVFLTQFASVPYRFAATATPSPNRYKELIHYAGFLGVMDTGQALTRWFKRDSTKANNLTLYEHKAQEFWLWLASWAVFIQRPSDLGHSDEGYDLPPLTLVEHVVDDDTDPGQDRDGQRRMIANAAVGVQDAARVKRSSLDSRVSAMSDILRQDPAGHFIIWHDLEDERRAIERAHPDVASVYGSQDLELREQIVADFSDGRRSKLAAKPVMLGSGPNLQRHCHKAIFLGIGHKFNDFIQAIHRLQRFLQTETVEVHVIYAESERPVWRNLLEKWARHKEMIKIMTDIIRKYGLDGRAMAEALTRSIGVERMEASGAGWLAAHNDCVEETRMMEESSVDLIVTSIPFGNHYEYSASYNDFGHSDDDDHFFAQMDHLTPQLLRILKPGRLACIHVKDRVLFGGVTGDGRPTINPFHCKTLMHYQRHGWMYQGMITVVTDVVRENNGNYRLGYTEMCKDGTKMGVGSPEYILLMAKPQTDQTRGYADDPVSRSKDSYSLARWQIDAHAFWRSSGDSLLTPDDLAAMSPDKLAKAFTAWSLAGLYDYETHVRIGEALELRGALPSSFMALAPGSHDPAVWHDVNRMLTLNTTQAAKGREAHVCPLQFDIVDRLIRRYSKPGELVFDPFGGLMTVPYRALKLGRRGRGVELHPGYWADGVKYLEAMEREVATPSLLDALDMHAEAGREAA